MSAVLIDSSDYVKMELGMHGRKLVSVASWEMQDCQNNIKSNYLTQNLKSILIHVQNIHPYHVFSWCFQAIFSCFSRMGWQTTCTGTRPTNGFARIPPEGFCSVCVVCSQVLRKVDEVVEGHEKKQPGRCEDDGGVWFWSDMFFCKIDDVAEWNEKWFLIGLLIYFMNICEHSPLVIPLVFAVASQDL